MINDCERAREGGRGSRTWCQGHSIDINVLLSTAHAHAGTPTHARPHGDIYMTGAFWRRRWHWRHFRPTRDGGWRVEGSGKSGKVAKVRQQQLSFVTSPARRVSTFPKPHSHPPPLPLPRNTGIFPHPRRHVSHAHWCNLDQLSDTHIYISLVFYDKLAILLPNWSDKYREVLSMAFKLVNIILNCKI